MDKMILEFVKKVRGRLREQAVIDGVLLSVIGGLSIAVLICAISIWVPMYYAIPVSEILVVISLLIGVVIGIRKTPSLEKSALLADSKGNKEKIVTALGLSGKEDSFSILQKKDAVRVIDAFRVKKEFPLSFSWKKSALLVVLAAFFAVTAAIDSPAKRLAVSRHKVKEEALKEIAKIEKVKKELDEIDTLDSAEKEQLDEELKKAEQDMQRATSSEELKKAEDIINKKMEMKAETVKDESAKKVLADAALQNKEDKSGASDDTSDSNTDNNANGDNGLQNGVQGQNGQSGQSGKQGQSGQQGESGKQGQNGQSGQSGEQGQSGQQGESGEQGQSGQQGESGEQRQNGQQGESGKQGQNGQQGESGKQGQNGQQGESGENGQNGQGGADNGGGKGWNRGSKNGSEGKTKINEDVTIPEGTVGDDENLTGKANENDTTIKQKSSQSNAWSGNKVSYGQVSGQYKEKAYKKVNGSNYPGKMKEKIRDYFDGLE